MSSISIETMLLIVMISVCCLVHAVRLCTKRFTQPIGLTYLLLLGAAVGRALTEEGTVHADLGAAFGSLASSTWFGMVVLSKPSKQTLAWDRSMVAGIVIGIHCAVLIAWLDDSTVPLVIVSTLKVALSPLNTEVEL